MINCGNSRVKSIDESGVYRVVDGGSAQSNLYGVYVSHSGEIYTSSQTNNFVQMKLLNSAQTQLSIGGTEGYDGDNQFYDVSNTKFYGPSSLIVSQNSIFVADKSNSCIRKIDLQTKLVSTIVGGLVNHQYGENISPFKMYIPGPISFPFYYKNELYFVEKSLLLRRVSNGKMTTLLGREQVNTPKYTGNIPQRIYFGISNLASFGNGDVLLFSQAAKSYFNFNVETGNLTLILDIEISSHQAIAILGDSFNNSIMYLRKTLSELVVFQNTTFLYSLEVNVPLGSLYQHVVFSNLRFPNSVSIFTYSNSLSILYEVVDFKNGSKLSNSSYSIPVPTPSFFTGFSKNTDKSMFFWTVGQIYDFHLETFTLTKFGGFDYLNVSNTIAFIYGFNGENIPIENSALGNVPSTYRDGSRILVSNVNHLSEISNGKVATIAGNSPMTGTLFPLILLRDQEKKITYYVDITTVKKFDETTGNSTSISSSLYTSVQMPLKTTYLTLNLQTALAAKNFGLFSKFDRKLYIRDSCRLVRFDPETSIFEAIIGNSCGLLKIGSKGDESPFPLQTLFYGMAIDETNGDVLLATELNIFRYSLKTQLISLEFTFTKSVNISKDGIMNNETYPGLITNIHYQEGYLYIVTSGAIRRVEKLSENSYYLRTVVGNLIPGYSGDNMQALESSLENPTAIYVKNNGDIIILDGAGSLIVRMYQKQSGLLVTIAGSRAENARFNGDGYGSYSIFTSFSRQVSYDEETGEIFLIDARSYFRKLIPSCGGNYTFNSWNNTCDLKLNCNGILATSSNVCNGNGQCIDFDVCQCKNDYEGQFCQIQKTTDSTVLIVAIVVPVVGSLLILAIVSIVIIVIVMCFSKKKKHHFEIAQMDTKNIELSDNAFPSTNSSMIISSSAGSSVGSVEDPFARYSNIIRIGQGSFGSVFKVTDTKQGNKLKAIKLIRFESFTDLNSIMKEASQLSHIKHPNIIKVNDYFITNDNLLIIDMDYYEMGDLTKLKLEFVNEKIIKQILKQMLSALKYVHEEMQIIHRDIKPTNVFIKKSSSDSIEVVLADFGLAKKYQEMKKQSYAGTPLFMSPEVALGSSYSYNTDIFSLGVSIYQIMTNDLNTSISNLLMGNQADNAIKILTKQMKESTQCEFSDELIEIVLKMLCKDANQRPSASQLLFIKFFK